MRREHALSAWIRIILAIMNEPAARAPGRAVEVAEPTIPFAP